MAESDSLYHRLFSHPVMVEHLVREFVPAAMAVGLDFGGMELVNVKYHSRKGHRREGDVVWRLPTAAGADIYLYLMIEFQARIDWWMAVRIQVYVGLLWQQIIRERKLKSTDLLPPVLPLVLFNADPRWDAPTDTVAMVALPPDSPLWPWQPQVRYHVLDMGAFPGDELARRDSLAALLFRLEQRHEPEKLADLVDEVIGWFRGHPGYEDLKALFTELVRQAIEGVGVSIAIPDELREMRTMLATQGQEWVRQWKAEGETKGKADMLLLLLRRRDKMLPAGIEDRVRAASCDQLDDWSERFADGKPLTEIFGPDQPH
ncbi:MAG: Rpn family recombination-promoting nuclease/putative transposase [Alphaproteobacteria bacterium]|nr:Rpn family recombination-promoting nuclease/putative transposase [Alphaproteobacteria bacterium]